MKRGANREESIADAFADADPDDEGDEIFEYDGNEGRIADEFGEEELEREPHDYRPVSTVPMGQLAAVDGPTRRRMARKRGLDWPSTEEARDRLKETIFDIMRNGDERVVDAPTALGKSGTIARTRWGAREDVTDEKQVVHLSATRDARDEAAEAAREHGGEHFVLQSRHEACPVARGDFDPPDTEDEPDELDYEPITIDGTAASQFISAMCDGRGLPFSAVHRHLDANNDQNTDLPCCADDGDDADRCWAIEQWDVLREEDHPLVIATHNFAHVPGLRMGTHLVIDEEPSFSTDLTTDNVRDIVGSYLRAIDAPVKTWESFIQTALYDGYGDDASDVRERLRDTLDEEPDREWYFEAEHAHALAPGLTRAIFHAEDTGNGRRRGKTAIEPPRLDAQAHEHDSWNKEWLTVVLDESNDVRGCWVAPDLQLAASVTGLDAHPALPLWQFNTVPHISKKAVLDPEERRLWRRFERGLRVVQVGEATRPLASGKYFDPKPTEAILRQLREQYGSDFRTAITAKSVEPQVKQLLKDVDVATPETMHFGEEKSRNDFADEKAGAVLGCLDPGDDFVLDLLAALDCDAAVERSEHECNHCDGEGCHECDGVGHQRARGRGFVGDDAGIAESILASIRENHTAQSAGRYARNADDEESFATVYVRTDAMPAGFADLKVPDVTWVAADKQETVLEAVRAREERFTAAEIAADLDVSKRHVQRTLKQLIEHDHLDHYLGTGPHGATEYVTNGTVPSADWMNDPGPLPETETGLVGGHYTWSVAIRDATDPFGGADTDEDDSDGGGAAAWDWRRGSDTLADGD